MSDDVLIYAHFHDCEERWHAQAKFAAIIAGQDDPLPVRMDAYHKDKSLAGDEVTQMIDLFLRQRGTRLV